jgi:hypothetical protein
MSVFQVTGTIVQVYAPVRVGGVILQQLVLENVTGNRNNTGIPSRVLVLVNLEGSAAPIDFRVNEPITVKGTFVQATRDALATIHTTHAPVGYVRYNGMVYR